MHLNIQSITNKSQALQRLAELHNIDVICLSEHWLTLNNQDLYNLGGYKWVNKFVRQQHIHGGVGILCKQDISTVELQDIADQSVEMDFESAAVYIPDRNIVVVVTYRSSVGNFDTYTVAMNEVLTKLMKQFPVDVSIIVCGDFNVHFSMKSCKAQEVVNIMRTFDLHQTTFHPTRNKATTDNIFTNTRNYEIEIIDGNLSDHEP